MVYDRTNFLDAPWDETDESSKHELCAGWHGKRGWRLMIPVGGIAPERWPGPFDSEETANLCLIAHRLSNGV